MDAVCQLTLNAHSLGLSITFLGELLAVTPAVLVEVRQEPCPLGFTGWRLPRSGRDLCCHFMGSLSMPNRQTIFYGSGSFDLLTRDVRQDV
jgi:hypothetical protein